MDNDVIDESDGATDNDDNNGDGAIDDDVDEDGDDDGAKDNDSNGDDAMDDDDDDDDNDDNGDDNDGAVVDNDDIDKTTTCRRALAKGMMVATRKPEEEEMVTDSVAIHTTIKQITGRGVVDGDN
jgi:hypothetical protein